MASKEKNELAYLQLPLPSGRKYYKMMKRSWSGLNKRQTIDTGVLSMENNISTAEAPYLTPSPKRVEYYSGYSNPIGLFGFDEFLIVIYRDGDDLKIDYITRFDTFTGILQSGGASSDDEKQPRSVVQFNVYDTPTDPVSGSYVKKLLIFPDKASMFMKIETALSNPTGWDSDKLSSMPNDRLYYYNNYYYFITKDEDGELYAKRNGRKGYFNLDGMDVLIKSYTNKEEPYLPPDTASKKYYYKNTYVTGDPTVDGSVYRWFDDEIDSENSGWKASVPPSVPNIKYAAVHLSRVFGVDDARVYASGYNDYTNWNLDTIDEYNESNSWCSPAQSNTKADGDFTGITVFQSHVICFKHDFMHEIYNTKNPFRLQDIFSEGTIDNRTVQEVDGRLIFVSSDGVKIYTGSNPRVIDYCINITKYVYAVSGSDGRNYYLYCEDENDEKHMFVYDTLSEQWSEQSINVRVVNFAHNKRGMYMLCDDGCIYKTDTKSYNQNWSFETDLITNETADIKHIKKIQMFAEIAPGANIKIYVLYDDEEFDENTSQLVRSESACGKTVIRIKPRQTAHYGIKLHVEGYGYIRLYELELFMETGGDLYV